MRYMNPNPFRVLFVLKVVRLRKYVIGKVIIGITHTEGPCHLSHYLLTKSPGTSEHSWVQGVVVSSVC